MKRRTFLRFSSAALAALGLSSCGAKSASSTGTSPDSYDNVGDDVGDEDLDLGMSLENAQTYSSYYNCPYFIHRTNGLFYPLAVPLVPFTSFGRRECPRHGTIPYGSPDYGVVFLDANQRNYYEDSYYLNISAGDELVFISTEFKVPEIVDIDPCYNVGSTISATFSESRICPLMQHRYDLYSSFSHTLDWQRDFRTYYRCYLLQTLPGQNPDSSYGGRGKVLTNSGSYTFNGLSPEDFEKQYSEQFEIHEATSDTDYFTFSNYPSSTLSVGYYEGSVYRTIDFDVSTTAFTFYSDYLDCGISELTQNGYAKISTDSLTPGSSYLVSCDLDNGNTANGLPLYALLYVQS